MNLLDLDWPAYDSVSVGPKGYTIPNGKVLRRVTTINRIVGDGVDALIRWSADTERAAVLNAATEVFANGESEGPAEFIADVEAHLGAARQHVKELAKAAEIGTSIHQMIQWTLRAELGEEPGPPIVLRDEAQWAFMAWQDWRKTQKWKPLRIEQPIWDEDRGYAGTADLIAVEDDQLVVPDWKSSKGVYSTHHLQLNAYCDAIEKRVGVPVKRAFIVKTPKNIGDDLIVVKDLGDMRYDYTKGGRRMTGGRVFSRPQLTQMFDAAILLDRYLNVRD